MRWLTRPGRSRIVSDPSSFDRLGNVVEMQICVAQSSTGIDK